MLVVVGLLLLIMSTLVSVFQYAGQAVSASRQYQQIDETLRRLDVLFRQDLEGITAPLNPPIDPDDMKGYFEYGENSFADLQGEDTDDYIAMTVKAPLGKPFAGRIWVTPFSNPNSIPGSIGPPAYPVSATSDYAEVIYFLRNGNLYRRVLLIVPDRMKSMSNLPLVPVNLNNLFNLQPWNGTLPTGIFGTPTYVSWQGMNDVSAHPNPLPSSTVGAYLPPVPNTLGDVTNRQNRFCKPRFSSDYSNNALSSGNTATGVPDGIDDDINGNGAADYYPTLYPQVFNTNLINEAAGAPPRTVNYDTLPFPFIYPGAYSQAEQATLGVGHIHTMDPQSLMLATQNGSTVSYANHSPLPAGDSLPTPPLGDLQTWWGFPTWREMMSVKWTDPVYQLNNQNTPGLQSPGLSWHTLFQTPTAFAFPPQMTLAYRNTAQPFTDNAGTTFASTNSLAHPLWFNIWEDDLIATNVRSFDIKAYDPNARAYAAVFQNDANVQLFFTPGYYDLGYASNPALFSNPANAYGNLTSTNAATLLTLGHEGRMPPLQSDNRLDAQWPASKPTTASLATTTPQAAPCGCAGPTTPGRPITPTPPTCRSTTSSTVRRSRNRFILLIQPPTPCRSGGSKSRSV